MALVAGDVVFSPSSPIQFTLGSIVALAYLVALLLSAVRLLSLQCGPAGTQHHMPTVAGEPHGARAVQRHCYQLMPLQLPLQQLRHLRRAPSSIPRALVINVSRDTAY